MASGCKVQLTGILLEKKQAIGKKSGNPYWTATVAWMGGQLKIFVGQELYNDLPAEGQAVGLVGIGKPRADGNGVELDNVQLIGGVESSESNEPTTRFKKTG